MLMTVVMLWVSQHALTIIPITIYDPVQRHFGYGQLWPVMAIMASVQPESGQII